MQKIFSGYFSLNTRERINGLVMAMVGAVIGTVYPTIQNWITSDNWNFVFDWHAVVKVALGAAVTYIVKNLLTNSEGKFLGTKTPDTVPVTYVAPNDAEQQNTKP